MNRSKKILGLLEQGKEDKMWRCEDCGYKTTSHKEGEPCPKCGSKEIYTFDSWRLKKPTRRTFGGLEDKEVELSADAQKKLSPEEQAMAKKFMIKGYKHVIQFELDGELFGAPMYFKTAEQVGPFMRSTAGGKLKQKWVVNL